MLRLRPYKICDAQSITQWFADEYAFRQWSADRYNNYPITPGDMNEYYEKDRENERIWGMTMFDESGIVGHFTMRYPDEDSFEEIRLGFIIVDDRKRGRGYGKEMVSMAVRYAFEFLKVKKVSLGVFVNNTAAIKCYRSCGFQEMKLESTERYCCMGEIWDCMEMVLENKEYLGKNQV